MGWALTLASGKLGHSSVTLQRLSIKCYQAELKKAKGGAKLFLNFSKISLETSLCITNVHTPLFSFSQIPSMTGSNIRSKQKAPTNIVAANVDVLLKKTL